MNDNTSRMSRIPKTLFYTVLIIDDQWLSDFPIISKEKDRFHLKL